MCFKDSAGLDLKHCVNTPSVDYTDVFPPTLCPIPGSQVLGKGIRPMSDPYCFSDFNHPCETDAPRKNQCVEIH